MNALLKRLIEVLLILALTTNPLIVAFAGVSNGTPSDRNAIAAILDIPERVAKAELTHPAKNELFFLNNSDCCCYQDHVGSCGGIDCQYCCSATLIQTKTLGRLINANDYRTPGNTRIETIEFPPPTHPPLIKPH